MEMRVPVTSYLSEMTMESSAVSWSQRITMYPMLIILDIVPSFRAQVVLTMLYTAMGMILLHLMVLSLHHLLLMQV